MSINSAKSPSYQDAFDPAASVFVAANAGAGKTRLLTNRVLRLLLHGVVPSKILCLTYTNAAAAEMSNRVLEELGKWVMAEEDALRQTLQNLMGMAPDKALMGRARALFAEVLEAPEGVRIQTIHGFCQALLKRFPLEAGTQAHFSVIDDRTEQELLQEARLRLLTHGKKSDTALQAALTALAMQCSESTFSELLSEIIKHKRRFRTAFHAPGGVEAATERLNHALTLAPGATCAGLIERHFDYDDDYAVTLRRIAGMLIQSNAKTDQATANALDRWLAQPQEREQYHSDYLRAFITNDGNARKQLCTKKGMDDAGLLEVLQAEQQRVLRFYEDCKKLRVFTQTVRVMHIAEALLSIYDALKRKQALMDYDDLILSACDLLQQPGIAPWVLYKLDGGIDHVLVDEAQDTSPEQWIIIDALTQEFFSGVGAYEGERSLFVVGDEKQSIYSFQGADPEALGKMRDYFSARIRDAALPVHTLDLLHSYRSTQEILKAVDSIFAQASAREGLTYGGDSFTHIPTRLAHPGLVEIWPLIEANEEAIASPVTLLARHIAGQIGEWLEKGAVLDAKRRNVQPGDIMILVRQRTTLVDTLVRALKRRNIPVAGADRMTLGDNLAVMDLCALGEFLLLPEDDLTLAALLKSPICGIGEEQLFMLAYDRGEESLWQQLRRYASQAEYKDAYTLLSDMRSRADYSSPFELYSHLLDTRGIRKRITGRMGEEYNDPLDEFLGQALLFEQSHTPSLQGFLHWLNTSESQIKRDMEQAGNAVRIMTVHGAKGLQAPIVILPDTTQIPRFKDMLLWHEHGGLPLGLWPGASAQDDKLCARLRGERKRLMMAEYRRLLYVALTRAEDRLYICGAQSKRTTGEESWYKLIHQGLQPIAEAMPEHEAGLRYGYPIHYRQAPQQTQSATITPLPVTDSFLHHAPPAEPLPPRPLAPSHESDEAPAATSPLTPASIYRLGTVMHRLLQHIPDMAIDQRREAALLLAEQYGEELSATEKQLAANEALRIIEHPEFAFLFAEDTLAEVPITGCVSLSGTVVTVSGQIDRLKVGEDAVWVVDYKSNRHPPASGVPAAYIRQLRLYKLLLAHIYPEKAIYCAVLWTALPALTIIDDALLD